MKFSALGGRVTLWEVNGVQRDPTRYDAPITMEEAERAQTVIAFGAVLDTIACRCRWKGRPEGARA